MLQALKDFVVKGLLVCESPDQEIDALILQEVFRQLEAKLKYGVSGSFRG